MSQPAPSFPIFPKLIESLRSARRVTVLTGAGISAESGVPTFREAQTGLWAQYDPEELATPQAFQRNPRLVWEWYAWRRELAAKAEPNPGHLALAQLEQRIPHFTLITQNVDGLHQRAGSQNVIELHGNIWRTICFDDRQVVDAWPDSEEIPPRCPRCGGLLRPDVVWFGESLPAQALDAAWTAAKQGELFLTVGTSAIVQPAASLPWVALEHGIPTVEINPNSTPLTPAMTYVLPGPAGQVLPALVKALEYE
jgi:NAD-dependent deacetylase